MAVAQTMLPAAIPNPLPGNSEYLVRVIYMIPNDRLLDYDLSPNCPQYNEKIEDAEKRIRTILETVDDFMQWNIDDLYSIPDPAGSRFNFERENNGNGPVRIMVFHGTMPTEGTSGYWGDDDGRGQSWTIWGRVINDVLPYDDRMELTEKTVYLIFPDVGHWDNAIGNIRGYTAGGQNYNLSASGWGGVAIVCAAVLPFFPAADNDPVLRKSALENYLSDRSSLLSTKNPYTWADVTWDLSTAYTPNLNQVAKACSLFGGVVAHEASHTYGTQHSLHGATYDPWTNIMSAESNRFGHGVSYMYGFTGDVYPYDQPGAGAHYRIAAFGPINSHYAAVSPYLADTVNPDKTDPQGAIAWPPNGYVWDGFPKNTITYSAMDNDSGSGMYSGYLIFRGLTLDYATPESSGIAELTKGTFQNYPGLPDPYIRDGLNLFRLSAKDKAGNLFRDAITTFYMKKEGSISNNAVYVAPSEYSRNTSSETGSWENPYVSIQSAINAASSLGWGTVFILNGTYDISSSLYPENNVSIVGESVGGVIFDGNGNTSLSILVADDSHGSGFSSTLVEITAISNLCFVNAGIGIEKNSGSNASNFAITNCIFYNMASAAIDIVEMDETVQIVQNTIVDCTSGILLDTYPDRSDPETTLDNPLHRFEVRNNIVVKRNGTGSRGIVLSDVQGYRSKPRSGWNNVKGYTQNYSGYDSYGWQRLPGEISEEVNFNLASTYDFSLQPTSSCVGEGDTSTFNADGSRRDMGAFINTPKPTAASWGWTMY